jgi:hypothetical protein
MTSAGKRRLLRMMAWKMADRGLSQGARLVFYTFHRLKNFVFNLLLEVTGIGRQDLLK